MIISLALIIKNPINPAITETVKADKDVRNDIKYR